MADIGDCNDQAIRTTRLARLVQHFTVDGVIKIARILAVDGDQWQFGQVNPFGIVGLAQFFRQPFCLGQGCRRKYMRQIKLAQGDFDFNPRIVFVTQHFSDLAARPGAILRVMGDRSRHHITLAPQRRLDADCHRVAEVAVARHHHPFFAITL